MAFSDHAALSRVQPDLHDAGPPYRADHVGSLLRPAALQQARARAESGAIGPASCNGSRTPLSPRRCRCRRKPASG